MLAAKQKICFFRNKEEIKLMKHKILLQGCKCIHCKQKLEQINRSRLYWDRLILSKKLTQNLV